MNVGISDLPTDCLYKFMALGGLTLCIAALLPFWWMYTVKIERIRLEGELLKYRQKNQDLVHNMKLETGPLMEKFGTTEIDDPDVKEVLKDVQETFGKWQPLFLDMSIRKGELSTKESEIKHATWTAQFLCIVGVVFLSIGLLLAASGFGCWYTRVQKHQDQLLMNAASTAQAMQPPATKADNTDAEVTEP